MDNIQSVHKWLQSYLVILFLLFVSRILAFNFMLMSVKIRGYHAIIIVLLYNPSKSSKKSLDGGRETFSESIKSAIVLWFSLLLGNSLNSRKL